MRAYIVILVVMAISLAALRWPRIGLLGYIWFSLMRPDFFAWAQSVFPFTLVLEIGTILGSVPYVVANVGVFFRNRLVWLLILLQVPLAFSAWFAVYPQVTSEPYIDYIRIIIMCLLIPVLIQTEKHLRQLFLVIAFSIGMIGIKFGLWAVVNGGAYTVNGYAGLENNGLALAFVMALPFLWYSRQLVSELYWKPAIVGAIAFTAVGTIMTNSRAGSLALGAALLLLTWRSRHRMVAVVAVALAIAPAMYLFWDRYSERMSTLLDPMEDVSAASRLVQIQLAYKMWQDYPLLGVGFGNDNYRILESKYSGVEAKDYRMVLKVHNTYFQVLVDSGIFAFLLFTAVLVSALWMTWWSYRWCRKHAPHLAMYPSALQVALLAYALFAMTGAKERYDFYYFVLMTSAAWMTVLRAAQTQRQQKPAPAVMEPVRVAVPVPAGAARRVSHMA